MLVIIRELDDNAAEFVVIETNLSIEEILPSERAFAYTWKTE